MIYCECIRMDLIRNRIARQSVQGCVYPDINCQCQYPGMRYPYRNARYKSITLDEQIQVSSTMGKNNFLSIAELIWHKKDLH